MNLHIFCSHAQFLFDLVHFWNLIPLQQEQQQPRTTKLLLGFLNVARGQKGISIDRSMKCSKFVTLIQICKVEEVGQEHHYFDAPILLLLSLFGFAFPIYRGGRFDKIEIRSRPSSLKKSV